MNSKKIDMTNFLYVSIMIIVFLLASCKTSKPIIPAAKYKNECCKTSEYWNGLNISNYTSIDGSNYLEDVMITFPDTSSN